MFFDGFSLTQFLLGIPALMLVLTVHEFAHGFAAYCLGDKTAKIDGRLSLNPLKHIDPIGFICILILHFGWAKPVMVDTRNFKSPKLDMALSAFAGPLSNFMLAFVVLLIYYPVQIFLADIPGISYLTLFLLQCFAMNIGLGIFNMLPVPPLDGSKTLAFFLPNDLYFQFIAGGRFGMVLLILLICTGATSNILSPIVTWFYEFYVSAVVWVYAWFLPLR